MHAFGIQGAANFLNKNRLACINEEICGEKGDPESVHKIRFGQSHNLKSKAVRFQKLRDTGRIIARNRYELHRGIILVCRRNTVKFLHFNDAGLAARVPKVVPDHRTVQSGTLDSVAVQGHQIRVNELRARRIGGEWVLAIL